MSGVPKPLVRLALVLALLAPAFAHAQQLSLKRAVPPVAWAGCPPASGPAPAQADEAKRAEAERLAESATEATILGNSAAALDLLTTAAGLDPASERIAYRRARVLEELDRHPEALAGYCTYLQLSPNGADAGEARQRIARLARSAGFAIPASAADAFRSGIALYDAQRLAEAESAFTTAAAVAPAWSDALYNRGVVRLALGNRSAATLDFRRYLEMTPGSPDLGTVLEVIGAAPAPVRPPYSPGTALATGLLVPGLGHFTTGRPVRGAIFLGLAAAAVTVGLVADKLEVDCLSVPVNGECPPDQIADQRTTRPLLVPGLAAAAALGIYGAIDAFLFARRGNAEAEALIRVGGAEGARGFTVYAPQLEAAADGARLDLLRIRF